jgi:hypothetical protein
MASAEASGALTIKARAQSQARIPQTTRSSNNHFSILREFHLRCFVVA